MVASSIFYNTISYSIIRLLNGAPTIKISHAEKGVRRAGEGECIHYAGPFWPGEWMKKTKQLGRFEMSVQSLDGHKTRGKKEPPMSHSQDMTRFAKSGTSGDACHSCFLFAILFFYPRHRGTLPTLSFPVARPTLLPEAIPSGFGRGGMRA